MLVGLVGTAIVWATPLASFVAPDDSLSTIVGFFVQLVLFTLTLSLGEELGWRGYLLPRLLSLGRTRALLVTGLVWAAWHLPLIFLTPLYHADGNRWLTVPLFVATIVAGSFFFGYLRLWTGSTGRLRSPTPPTTAPGASSPPSPSPPNRWSSTSTWSATTAYSS